MTFNPNVGELIWGIWAKKTQKTPCAPVPPKNHPGYLPSLLEESRSRQRGTYEDRQPETEKGLGLGLVGVFPGRIGRIWPRY